ncbi:MAG: hypothetical protein Q7T59_01640 [Candidatus Woesebacteria bacterium]|nr:hypothetical protein [Candidatus Woesebacteria bacterium]
MSQFSDHPGFGYEDRHFHAPQHLSDADRRFDKSDRSGVAIRDPESSRDLDDIGHAVNVRHVPDFWKPCEDWTLD